MRDPWGRRRDPDVILREIEVAVATTTGEQEEVLELVKELLESTSQLIMSGLTMALGREATLEDFRSVMRLGH